MLLLVDDDAEQLELRQTILEREGFAVATAGSAAQAMAHCDGCRAVVMDLRLPALRDGLELIRGLHAKAPGAPIVVLAGLPEELEGRPESALVRHVIRKGTRTAVLLDLLHSLIR